MHHSKTRFSNRVDNYVRYRPHYPDALVKTLEEQRVLQGGSIVADVGSGTGISTELFLKKGYSCIGVEPNRDMRLAAERELRAYPAFTSAEGSAEETGLEENSVDLVIAGQAFHWFDQQASKLEFNRILKTGGHVALLWNKRNTEGSAFQADYEELLNQFCNDYALVDYKHVTDDDLAAFFSPNPFQEFHFPNFQHFDWESLKGRLLSSSYCPVEGESNYEATMAALRNLYENHQAEGRVTFVYRTHLYVGSVKPGI